MKKHRFTSKRIMKTNPGFTLIEVLVALVILSVGLLGTAAFLTNIIKSDKLSNEMSTAVVLAQDKMEDLFQAAYLGIIDDMGVPGTTNENLSASGYPDFERITSTFSTGTAGALGVAVTVNYKAFGDHSYTVRTIVSRDIK
jgi:type IV pilus assembly protein PilV